jgi:hypothetical protein
MSGSDFATVRLSPRTNLMSVATLQGEHLFLGQDRCPKRQIRRPLPYVAMGFMI